MLAETHVLIKKHQIYNVNTLNTKIQVPVELCRYVQSNKLAKPFSLYIYLKCVSNGKINCKSTEFKALKSELGIKSDRSIKKYLQKLLQLNWIGFNANSGFYFIRGFDYLRYTNEYKSRQATTFYYKDIKKVHQFIIGTILNAEVNKQKFIREVVIPRKLRTATNNRDVAYQSLAFADYPFPGYYGLSVHRIAVLLNCKKSHASALKIKTHKAGFIKVKHQFKELMVLQNHDFKMRAALQEDPEYTGKIQFRKATIRGVKCVRVLLQTFDEIIPKMNFKTISKFNNLQISAITIAAKANKNEPVSAAA